MAMTQTQAIKGVMMVADPSRRYDYLYDPICFLGSERDHARATFKARASKDFVKKVPIFTSMYSDLQHYPSFQMRLQVTDPVPKFISKLWRGYGDQERESLIQYTKCNYAPSVKIPKLYFKDPEVSGRNRTKYFKRPLIPFMEQTPADVVLSSTRQDHIPAVDLSMKKQAASPLSKSIQTQTMYRESETQTDPYSPEYVVQPGSSPELLTLANLSYGQGLPAGWAEVEMIERAHAKTIWEKTLPPVSNLSEHKKRLHMMEDMERKEWAYREKEIERLQEIRLQVLKKLLEERDSKRYKLKIKKLDRLWTRLQKNKEVKIKKLQHEQMRVIRKLSQEQRNVEKKLVRRDIIKDYTNYGSQAFAPLTRIGLFPDRNSEQYVVKSRFLSTHTDLLEFEASLPEYVLQPRIKAPKPKVHMIGTYVKRNFRKEKELEDVYRRLKVMKETKVEPSPPLHFLKRVEKPIARPPTPGLESPPEDEDEADLAVIFLQQLLRGRAIQNMIFEGKEKRIELIKELRSTHALQEEQQQLKKKEMLATLALQRDRRLHEHKELLENEALSYLEGGTMGDMLDFLSKELVRLQEERRIHAYAMMAERDRRMREAEESGRRQEEERRRREEDEIFKQLVKVHQMSVDVYLEDVIMLSMEHTAAERARAEIQEMAKKINDVVYELEKSRTDIESEEIVGDLVHSFLLPEVEKQLMQEKVKSSQKKFLLAAHKEIHKTGEEIIALMPPSGPKKDLPSDTDLNEADRASVNDNIKDQLSTSSIVSEDTRFSLDISPKSLTQIL